MAYSTSRTCIILNLDYSAWQVSLKLGMSLDAHAQLTAVTMDTGMFIFCTYADTHVH